MIAGQHGDTSLTGKPKVVRSYFQWGDSAREDKAIREAHANGQVPWVSFKPPSDGVAGILAGNHNQEIVQRGFRYLNYSKRVLTTFWHEPVGDVQPEEFWDGFNYIKTAMQFGPRGRLNRATFTPILNGYIYADWYKQVGNPKGDLEEWVAPGVNLHTFGFDNYGSVSELARMFNDLEARGVQHVALGEFGRDQGAASFRSKLALFRSLAGFLNIVCFFNSRIQVLEAGSQELADWRAFLQEFN